MSNDTPTVSLAELTAVAPLRSVEAVTIVREIVTRIAVGAIAGVPSPQIIRLSRDGRITVEGPIAADALTVPHAAHLLSAILPGFDVRTTDHVPGALRLIIARAGRTLDLPPYPSLDAFAADLYRFAAPDAEQCVRELLAARHQPIEDVSAEALAVAVNGTAGNHTLTISDIRRARRATGLTLADISSQTGIPARLLCELEWGYLDHWPAPAAARRLMLRYARSAGLDEQLVLDVAWPLLQARPRGRDETPKALPVIDAVPLDDVGEIDVGEIEIESPSADVVSLVACQDSRRTRRSRIRSFLVAALAIPALLLIGIVPHARDYISTLHHPKAAAAAPVGASAEPGATPAAPPALAPKTAPLEPTQPVEPSDRMVQRVRVSDEPTYSPAFASGGTAIFHHAETGDHSALMRADTDGGGSVLRITSIVDDQSHDFHARPSPDGRRIAFDSDRDGERGVYIADADGHNVHRVTGDGFAAIPNWSPVGETLAFIRAESDRPDVWNLWIMDLTSGEERRLTSYHDGQLWGGSWFPGGQRIAYSHEDRLIVLNLETGAMRIYPSPRKGTLLRTPAVSPDGTRAVFQVYRVGTWLLDFRSGAMKKVLADPSAEDYAWSPDGRRIAYHSRSAGKWGVWIVTEPSNP